jgi:HEAT repeat protein
MMIQGRFPSQLWLRLVHGAIFTTGTLILLLDGSAVTAFEQPAPADSKPGVELTFHKDGSVTFKLDGKEQVILAGHVRKRTAELLAGKKTAIFHIEDWPGFERQGIEWLPDLYELGLRTITFKVRYDGMVRSRTVDLRPPSLGKQLLDGTQQARAVALDKLKVMMHSADSNQRVAALDALIESQRARFDRAQFLPLVRKSVEAGSATEIGRALTALPLVGGGETDVARVLAHASHADPSIRARICTALYGLDPAGMHAGIGPALEKLLNDKVDMVRVSTFQSLWGRPSTAEVDAKLIEMSRGPGRGGSSEADETIYYALSTRPLVRKATAERLREIIRDSAFHRSRAVWGLSHHQADDEARPIAIDTLIGLLDSEIDHETRRDAIWGLGFHGGAKAVNKLEAIATNPNESETMRVYARQQMRGRSVNKARQPGATPQLALEAKPGRLWEQLVQPHDPKLRRLASGKVVQMLKEPATISTALEALLDAHEGSFDRAPFVPLVRPLLKSTDADVRALALSTLATFRNDAIDAATLAAAAGDQSRVVRRAVAESLLRVDPKATQSPTSPTIEKLLVDSDPEVVRAMVRSVWGRPLTAAAESTLLDLSHHPQHSYDAVYYGLSTRPLIRKAVAERLIELAFNSKEHSGRAIWGLTHHKAAEEARDLIVDALIKVVDDFSDGYDRRNAIYGLGRLGTPRARQRLQKIVEAPDESDFSKTQASKQLKDSGHP